MFQQPSWIGKVNPVREGLDSDGRVTDGLTNGSTARLCFHRPRESGCFDNSVNRAKSLALKVLAKGRFSEDAREDCNADKGDLI